MTRRLAPLSVLVALLAGLVVLVGGCGDRERAAPVKVPRTWADVRDSAGHAVHVGKKGIPCKDCPGDAGFENPPADLCERCPGTKPIPPHRFNPESRPPPSGIG